MTREPTRDPAADYPVGGSGERYCPWCRAVLFTAEGSDPVKAVRTHHKHAAHSGVARYTGTAVSEAKASRIYALKTPTEAAEDG